MTRGRQARAIALLPGTVTVLVPAILLIALEPPVIGWGLEGALAALVILAAIGLIAAGLALWIWTARLFARLGEGTLAPWDPPRRLVVQGPYGHVRNPMITAVMTVLIGEGILFGSPVLFAWCATFFAINHLFFVVREEPGLEQRFGDDYRLYKRNVPRWVPRRTPWAASY